MMIIMIWTVLLVSKLCLNIGLILQGLFFSTEAQYISRKVLMSNLYWECSISSIHYMVFTIIISYIHIDGRIHIETIYLVIAWYTRLRCAIVDALYNGIDLLCEAAVSCERVQVPVS